MKHIFTTIAFAFVLPFSIPATENETQIDSSENLTFNINADIVSRYVWRGLAQNLTPNIQPYASLQYKNFTVGAWASYGVSSYYAEIDLFATYNISMFSLTLNDYYNEDENDLSLNDYFNWKNSGNITTHILEGVVSFNGTEGLPLSLTAGTFLYGPDKDSTGDNYFSTYMELAYSFSIAKTEMKIFAGGTLKEGYYADKTAIINTGLSFSKEIKVTDSFSIPISSSFIVNPNAKDVFFVFGITF